jgi:hypothetical protein
VGLRTCDTVIINRVMKGYLYDEFFDPVPMWFLMAVICVLTIVTKCTHPVAEQEMDNELENLPNISSGIPDDQLG